MKCKQCFGPLEVVRGCGSVQMRCTKCGKTFSIHEVADQLDSRTEKILEQYNTIIYD